MPELRPVRKRRGGTGKAGVREIRRAQKLRSEGKTATEVAFLMKRSESWVRAKTTGYLRPKVTDELTPEQAALRLRVLNLQKRGFDVPPSKQSDFDTLKRSGYTLEERRQMLNLE